jgi:hypothetical protein
MKMERAAASARANNLHGGAPKLFDADSVLLVQNKTLIADLRVDMNAPHRFL